MSKLYAQLGLVRRAGKLANGEESVMAGIRSGEAKLVVIAADASKRSLKKYADKCQYYHIPMIVFGNKEELGASIGRAEQVAVAVMDSGFAQMIAKSQGKPAEVESIE